MSKSYDYVKMNEMETILISLEMPQKLSNTRTVLTLLAIAGLAESTKWNKAQETYLRVHDMIVFINEHYPKKGGTDLNGEVIRKILGRQYETIQLHHYAILLF